MAAIREPPHRTNRILVADEDQQVRRLFARKLRGAGYGVSEARSGSETLDLLEAMRFSLLILDLDLPDTDGFDVLKAVRTDFPHVRVLVVSGYSHEALLEAASFLGAARALEKPAAPHLLLETVRLLLGDTR